MRQPSQQPERARHGVDLSPTTSDEEQHNNNAEEKNNEEDEKEEETVLETVLATQVTARDPAHNSSCLKTYLRQNRDTKTLLAMTHGVVDPDRNGPLSIQILNHIYRTKRSRTLNRINRTTS